MAIVCTSINGTDADDDTDDDNDDSGSLYFPLRPKSKTLI